MAVDKEANSLSRAYRRPYITVRKTISRLKELDDSRSWVDSPMLLRGLPVVVYGVTLSALHRSRLTLAIRQFAIGESRSLLAKKNKTLRQFG